MLGKHCLSVTVTHASAGVLCCVVLCYSPVEQHSPWAAAKSTVAPHKQLASSFYCIRYFDIGSYDRG